MLVLSTVFFYLFENTDYTCLIFNFSFILSFWPSNSSLCNVRQRDLPHIGDFLTLPSLLNYTLWISLHSSNTTLEGSDPPFLLCGPGSNGGEGGFSGESTVVHLLQQQGKSSILLFSYRPFSYYLELCWWYCCCCFLLKAITHAGQYEKRRNQNLRVSPQNSIVLVPSSFHIQVIFPCMKSNQIMSS